MHINYRSILFAISSGTLALSFGTLALCAPSVATRDRAPFGYPYSFLNFKSVASDGTASNYSRLYLSYNNNGPRGINDNGMIELVSYANGITYALGPNNTEIAKHKSQMAMIFPDSCHADWFCYGGINLTSNNEVQIMERYEGLPAFYIDFHAGSPTNYNPSTLAKLGFDGYFYVCDTKLGGAACTNQLFYTHAQDQIPEWCGRTGFEVEYPNF